MESSLWDCLSLEIQLYITSLAWRQCFDDFKRYLPIDLLCKEMRCHALLSNIFAKVGKIKYMHARRLVIKCPNNICTNRSWLYSSEENY